MASRCRFANEIASYVKRENRAKNPIVKGVSFMYFRARPWPPEGLKSEYFRRFREDRKTKKRPVATMSESYRPRAYYYVLSSSSYTHRAAQINPDPRVFVHAYANIKRIILLYYYRIIRRAWRQNRQWRQNDSKNGFTIARISSSSADVGQVHRWRTTAYVHIMSARNSNYIKF